MMRFLPRPALAAGAAILAAATVTPALAQDSQVHVMTVQLPNGALEHIQYVGNVPPRLVVMPAPELVAVPMMAIDPAALIARISAMMDSQAEAMFRQPPPTGGHGYSFVSTNLASGVCARSVSITFGPGDAQPRVVSSSSGNCGPVGGTQAPMNTTVPAPSAAPRTLEVNATTPGQAAKPVQVAWNRPG